MTLPPTAARPVAVSPPSRQLAARGRNTVGHRRGREKKPRHEIVWSEAEGRLIDVEVDARDGLSVTVPVALGVRKPGHAREFVFVPREMISPARPAPLVSAADQSPPEDRPTIGQRTGPDRNTDHGLPRSAPPSSHARASTEIEPDQPTPASRRILIVDDDPDVRNTVAELLRRAGYGVSCAEDGEAGWKALCADRFDVLITDHEMPRLTGLELLRRVRAGPLPVPVILISGRLPAEETDLPRLLHPGMALEKPFSWVDLLTTVRNFLSSPMRVDATGGQSLPNPDPT